MNFSPDIPLFTTIQTNSVAKDNFDWVRNTIELVIDDIPDLIFSQHVHHFPHIGVSQDHVSLLLTESLITYKPVTNN